MACGYDLWMDTYVFGFWRTEREDGQVYMMKFKNGEKQVSFTKIDEEYHVEKVGLDDEEVADFLNDVCVFLLEKIGRYFEVCAYEEDWKTAYDGIFEFLTSYLKENKQLYSQ